MWGQILKMGRVAGLMMVWVKEMVIGGHWQFAPSIATALQHRSFGVQRAVRAPPSLRVGSCICQRRKVVNLAPAESFEVEA